jgi:hypothetical protein
MSDPEGLVPEPGSLPTTTAAADAESATQTDAGRKGDREQPPSPDAKRPDPNASDRSDTKPQGTGARSFSSDGSDATRAFSPQSERPPRAERARRTLGPDGSIAELIDMVHCDLVDKNRRVVLVGSRLAAADMARSLGACFGDGDVLTLREQPGMAALEAWLRDTPGSAGPRVLVLTTTYSQAAHGLGLAAPFADEVGNRDKVAELTALLDAADVRLLLAVEIDGLPLFGAVTGLLPDLYLLPWLGPWLAAYEKATGVTATALHTQIGHDLRMAAEISGHEDGDRELALFQQLRDLLTTGVGKDHSGSVKAIREALEGVGKLDDPDRLTGRALVRSLLSTVEAGPIRPEVYGEARPDKPTDKPTGKSTDKASAITRTLFPVAVLTPGCPFSAIRWLTARLLPDGPVPRDLLPRFERDSWQLAYEDARRLGRPHPALPEWRQVFEAHADDWLRICHLRRGDRLVELQSSFGREDPVPILKADWQGLLGDMLDKIIASDLYRQADGEERTALATLHLMLAESLNRKQPDEILTAIAGLAHGARDFPIAGRMPDLLADLLEAGRNLPGEATLADLAEVIDPLRALQAVAHANDDERAAAAFEQLADRIDEQVTEMRHADARRLAMTLTVLAEVAAGRGGLADLPERVFARVADRLAPESALLVCAYVVLGVRAVSGDALGKVTTEVIRSVKPQAIPDVDRFLRQLWADLLDYADTLVGGGDIPAADLPAVDAWIDGLRKAAVTVPVCVSLPTVAEDLVTTYNISHNFRLEETGTRQPPAIAVRQLTLAPAAAPPLLARMLARRPSDWIADLLRHEALLTVGGVRRFSAEDQIATRLRDVVAVLLGGLDDASRNWLDRAGRLEVIPAAVLFDLGSDGRLPSLSNAQIAARRILAASAGSAHSSASVLEMLTLYPAALLAEWRFRLFGVDTPDLGAAGDYKAVAGALRAAVRAAGRADAVADAFATLARAERNLARRFDLDGLGDTARRFDAKAAIFTSFETLFRPNRPAEKALVSLSDPAGSVRQS